MTCLQTLQSFKKRLVEYLKLKVEQEDWHGVSDAANDIREVDAKIAVLKEIKDALPNGGTAVGQGEPSFTSFKDLTEEEWAVLDESLKHVGLRTKNE